MLCIFGIFQFLIANPTRLERTKRPSRTSRPFSSCATCPRSPRPRPIPQTHTGQRRLRNCLTRRRSTSSHTANGGWSKMRTGISGCTTLGGARTGRRCLGGRGSGGGSGGWSWGAAGESIRSGFLLWEKEGFALGWLLTDAFGAYMLCFASPRLLF